MKILFLRGWQSAVGGVKPTYLKDHGHEIVNPELDDDDFAIAQRTAQEHFLWFQPDVILGSSRGGAIAMNIASGSIPLVLLCPAWKRWGGLKPIKRNSLILHSRQDDVIPFEESQELIEASGLPHETLIEVGSDHRLADQDSLSVMLWACKVLVSGETLPWLDGEMEESKATRRSEQRTLEEAAYLCDACGEEIVIPLDLTEGSNQTYVEDCPVCCRANIIHVHVNSNGATEVWASPEQDYE
jgi:hypothetical protein